MFTFLIAKFEHHFNDILSRDNVCTISLFPIPSTEEDNLYIILVEWFSFAQRWSNCSCDESILIWIQTAPADCNVQFILY